MSHHQADGVAPYTTRIQLVDHSSDDSSDTVQSIDERITMSPSDPSPKRAYKLLSQKTTMALRL